VAPMKRISLVLAAVFAVAVPVTAATTAGASTKLRVFFPSDCQHNKYKPKSFVVTCADANFTVKKVKYSAYGTKTAAGTGTASVNTCDPDCASGTFKSYPVKLTLSRVKQCGDVPQFTRAKITFTGARPAGQSKTLVQPFTCAIPPAR
jgi:hypothetical protein